MIAKDLARNSITLTVDQDIMMRVINIADVTSTYVRWLNDREVTKYTDQQFTKQTLKTISQFVTEKYNSKNDLLFGIFYKKKHIGNIKIGPIDDSNNSAQISYFIGEKQFWGKGISTKCINKIIGFSFGQLNLTEIRAFFDEKNKATEKILIKCGFIIDEIKPKRLASGTIINLVCMIKRRPNR